MKKIICTAVSALALAAFADGVNSTEFGVLTVPSSSMETIVGVPWLASGTGTDPVKVADLVLTASFVAGDELLLYSGSSYTAAWVLTNDGGTLKWKGQDIVTTKGKIPGGDDNTPISRGSALMLKRINSSAGNFYVMGKPASAEGGTLSGIPGGSADTTAFTLIAPARTQDTNVGDLTFTGLKSMSDYIIVDAAVGLRTLTYTSKGWYNPKTKAYNDVSIPAGKGFWFRSNSAGEKTVQWPN